MPLNKPVVSVIIPTYNRALLIERSITSVLEQTYGDFELIVVDDGSTDDTLEIVRSIPDKRLRLYSPGVHRGAAFARNEGIRVARGAYVAFQDSDDEWMRDKLEKQMQVMDPASPEAGLVYTGYWSIRDDRRIYLPSPALSPKEGKIHKALLDGNFITTQTVLMRADCFSLAGMFDERLPRLQDWDLWLRVSKHFDFRFIDEPLVNVHFQQESISVNEKKLVEAFEMILEKYAEDWRNEPKSLARVYFSTGAHLLHSGKAASMETSYLRRAIGLDPANLKYLRYGLLTLFGKRGFEKIRALYRKLKRADPR